MLSVRSTDRQTRAIFLQHKQNVRITTTFLHDLLWVPPCASSIFGIWHRCRRCAVASPCRDLMAVCAIQQTERPQTHKRTINFPTPKACHPNQLRPPKWCFMRYACFFVALRRLHRASNTDKRYNYYTGVSTYRIKSSTRNKCSPDTFSRKRAPTMHVLAINRKHSQPDPSNPLNTYINVNVSDR